MRLGGFEYQVNSGALIRRTRLNRDELPAQAATFLVFIYLHRV
jgi:hypothetical protein